MKSADGAAKLYLRSRQLDPALQFLLSQQLKLCNEKNKQPPVSIPSKVSQQLDVQNLFNCQQLERHRQQKQYQTSLQHSSMMYQHQQQPRNQILAHCNRSEQILPTMATSEAMNFAFAPSVSSGNIGPKNSGSEMNLWQQIQAHKQKEAQLAQLRQLMALNLQRQQNRDHSSAKNFRASAA
ncbi:hypothetical protein IV203_036351 [Nitzschia inconspicua]|uniref:Uncharacterized protein n=1 Tax=Nitzschia inconspicua TaxID=303405 RepID=A0A9K3LHW6_9STRA|nr:hypothetical protein IV203_036351 [Nitzschia inconspicua]